VLDRGAPVDGSCPLAVEQVTTRSPWAVVATVAVGLWAVGVTVVADAVAWLAGQILMPGPAWLWPAAGVLGGVLATAPAALLAVLPKSPTIRGVGRAWRLGALALAVLSLARAVPEQHNMVYLLCLALLATPFAGRLGGDGVAKGLAGGLATLIPWLCLTALGGLLETLAAIVAA